MQVAVFPFGQQKDRFDDIQFAVGVLPKLGWNETGHIAAVAVDIHLEHPIFERFGHILAHGSLHIV